MKKKNDQKRGKRRDGNMVVLILRNKEVSGSMKSTGAKLESLPRLYDKSA